MHTHAGYITAEDLIRMMRSVGETITIEEAQDMIREGDKVCVSACHVVCHAATSPFLFATSTH